MRLLETSLGRKAHPENFGKLSVPSDSTAEVAHDVSSSLQFAPIQAQLHPIA
jgi:hypothetical protein